MLSDYLQFQLFATTYFLAVAAFGVWGFDLCCPRRHREQPLFPIPPPQPQQQGEAVCELIGWYKLQNGENAPLFYSYRKNRYAYIHKGTLVHPSEAAVRRRGVRHPPPSL
jgi:hypothetical protein